MNSTVKYNRCMVYQIHLGHDQYTNFHKCSKVHNELAVVTISLLPVKRVIFMMLTSNENEDKLN